MKDLLIGKGQSLVEVLITLSLVAAFLVIIYSTFNSSQFLSLEAANYLQALNLANNEIEKLRELAKTNFEQITNSTTINGNFSLETIVNNIDDYTKKVNLKVSWNLNRPQSLTLTSYFVDWKNIPLDDGSGGAGGGSGGGGLSGDWRNPTTLKSIDLGPGNKGTDVNVKFNTAFVSGVASDDKKPDLFIIDVTNPSNPSIKSTLNTGPGVNSLSVRGNYAYLANNKTSQQLQIVDISNEKNPVLRSQITLPDNNTYPLSIFAFKNYVVISTKRSSGPQVFIYDVTNPLSPSLVSRINLNQDINDVFVLKNRLYLVGNKIFIYDLTNISSPQPIANFSLPNDTGYSIFPLSYNLLLVGGSDKLYFLDTSNLNSIRIISTFSTDGKVNDIYARENLAFLATSNLNKEFQIVDYSNLNNPSPYSNYDFPQEATGIDYRNNLIFVSVRSNDALRIITSQ